MDILQTNQAGKGLRRRSGLDYWSNLFLLLYILTMPFVSAFAYTDIVTMPLIFSLFLFFVMMARILQSLRLPEGFLGLDIVLIALFIFLVIFSFLVNGWGNAKSLNHTAAYVSTFLLFYVGIKFTLFAAPHRNAVIKKSLQFLTYAVIISALYGNVEFISANIFGVNLNDYIPRPNEAEAFYNPTVLALFYRARGFASESGVFTQMLELFAPISIYYMFFSGHCKWSKLIRILITVSIILSVIFAASSATFIILPFAIVASSVFYIRKIIRIFARKSWFFHLKTIAIILVVLLINSYLSIYESIFMSVSEKLDSNSYYDRQDKIKFFYAQFYQFSPIKKLVGAGPAGSNIMGYKDTGSIISLFYNVTFELGLIGLMLLLLIMGYFLGNNFKIKTKIGWFLMVSLVSGITHYLVVDNYWVPWFWFIGAFTVLYGWAARGNEPLECL